MKKPKQHHHFILGLQKPEEEEKKFGLNVNRTILQSSLPEYLKEEYCNALRERLSVNRQFIKDLRASKKPIMIHEKLMAEKWELHADSMTKIKEYVINHDATNKISMSEI